MRLCGQKKVETVKLGGRGTDDTLYATMSGYVKYEHLGKDRKQVSVYETRA